MSKKIGRLINLGIAKESTRGTPVAATHWLPKSSITFSDKVQKALSTMGYGNIGDGNQELVALKWAEGNVDFDLMDNSFGLILLALLGTVSSSTTGGVTTHTFTLQNDNQHDSLTFWVEDVSESIDIFFPLVMINSFSLSAVPEDVVKCSVGFMGKSSSDTSALSATYTAENKFVGRHVSVKIADLTSGLTAASVLDVKELTLEVNKNVMRDHALSTVQAVDLLNQKIEITGTIMLDLEAETYKDYMMDGSYKALRIDIQNSGVTLADGTSHPQFIIDLSRVAFDSWEPTRENDAIATQTINFRALYDLTNADTINSCKLVNQHASY